MSETLYKNRNFITLSTLFSFFLLGSVLFTYGLENIGFYVNWIIGVFFIAISLLYIFFIKQKIKKSILYSWILLLLWIPLVLLLTPFARDISLHLTYTIITVFYVSYSVLIVNYLLGSNKRFVGTLFLLNVFWCLINIIFLILYIFGYLNYYGDEQFSGIFINRNQFALITTILFFFNLNNKKYFQRKAFLNLLLITDIVLIFSALSMKGFLGLFLILFIQYWEYIKRIRKWPVILILSIFFLGIILIDNPIKVRFDRFILVYKNPKSLKISESAYERSWLFKEGLKLTRKHLATGVGVNNSRYFLVTPYDKLLEERGQKEKGSLGSYSHCNYIEMLLNGGILGFILYYTPIFLILFSSLKSSLHDKTFRTIYVLLFYKLFLDIAMVSYFDLAHTLILAFSFVLYFKKKYNEPQYD